jgi:hypothetical protein
MSIFEWLSAMAKLVFHLSCFYYHTSHQELAEFEVQTIIFDIFESRDFLLGKEILRRPYSNWPDLKATSNGFQPHQKHIIGRAKMIAKDGISA